MDTYRDDHGRVYIWNKEPDGVVSRQIGRSQEATCMTQLFDTRIVTGGKDNRIQFWDLASGQSGLNIQCRIFKNQKTSTSRYGLQQTKLRSILNLVELPGGRLASSGYSLHGVRIWDIHDGTCLRVISHIKVKAGNMKLIGMYLVAANTDEGQIEIWL